MNILFQIWNFSFMHCSGSICAITHIKTVCLKVHCEHPRVHFMPSLQWVIPTSPQQRTIVKPKHYYQIHSQPKSSSVFSANISIEVKWKSQNHPNGLNDPSIFSVAYVVLLLRMSFIMGLLLVTLAGKSSGKILLVDYKIWIFAEPSSDEQWGKIRNMIHVPVVATIVLLILSPGQIVRSADLWNVLR